MEFVVGEERKVIPGHIAIIAARSFWLRERIREARVERERTKKVGGIGGDGMNNVDSH